MRALAHFLPVLAGLSYALPQDGCSTTTTELIVPTKTYTYLSTRVVTQHPTGAKDLGTFTLITTYSTTTTLATLTATSTICHATGIAVAPVYTTVYSNGTTPSRLKPYKRELGLLPRDDPCVVTVTTTTTYGVTQTYVPANQTSTYYDYTDFTQATVTSTATGGRAYVIATAIATTTVAVCGTTTVTGARTSTTTQDPRCAPSAITSAYRGFGLEWKSDTPLTGASWFTTTDDASQCCQLCAQASYCAASSWDIRSGQCTLEFPVENESGSLNCGEGLLAYYDAGPNHPMAPGTGLFVQALCGDLAFGNAKPDDGS